MSPLVIRLGILVAIFASAFIVSQVLLESAWRARSRHAAINLRLRLIKEGHDQGSVMARLRKNAPRSYSALPAPIAELMHRLQSRLFSSGIAITTGQLLVGIATAFLAAEITLMLLARSLGFLLRSGVFVFVTTLAVCVAIVLPISIVSMMAQRRRKKIEQQFPVALDVFVRALRSGHPVASAIELLTQELEDPIGSEFGLVADEVSYGAELTEALDAMAERWDLEDMRMFVVSLSVQSETGGNLAEILENLADVIRARASVYLKVRALSSEGRMTGWMLTVLPVLAFVGMFLVNPGFYLDVAGDPLFLMGFGALVGLYLLGVFMIRQMIDIKV